MTKEYNENLIFDNEIDTGDENLSPFSLEAMARSLAERLIRDWREAGYDRAADCLRNALQNLLTFFEFPPEHARHLRTTNPVESPFATIRLRTNAARRFRTARSGLHLVFKLLERCQKGWRKISHPEKLREVRLPE